MDFIRGISYNLRGLRLGIRTPRLLWLGMIRFALVIVMTVAAASVILLYHQEILAAIWTRPESLWMLWLWYLASWLLSAILFALATVIAYLVCQVLFAVVIMDTMSRITEAMVSGRVAASGEMSFFRQLVFLARQEIPRAVVPMLLLLVLTLLGWLTPLGTRGDGVVVRDCRDFSGLGQYGPDSGPGGCGRSGSVFGFCSAPFFSIWDSGCCSLFRY